MAVSLIDVNLVEKLLLHKPVVALWCVIVDRVIFIKVKAYNVFETQSFFLVKSYQFCVKRFWRRTGCETKYAVLSCGGFFPDNTSNFLRNERRADFVGFKNSNRNFFERI